MPYKHHPDWRPASHDLFDQGHASLVSIMFGSAQKNVGDEHVQVQRHQRTL